MPFLRSLEYHQNRFHEKQEKAWLGYKAGLDLVLPMSRRSGKCLAMNTLIMTPGGPKAIQDLRVGDLVYSEDGKPIKILEIHNQGIKKVVDLTSGKRVLETCTLDHRWLAMEDRDRREELRKTDDLSKHYPIKRVYVECPLGDIDEPHAYVIAAMLGNGCRLKKGLRLCISSEDATVPNKVAAILKKNAFKQSGNNFNYWIAETFGRRGVRENLVTFSHNEEWIKGRLSHEKICDLEVVKTWNRTSLLNFIAGLIDTDGSVHIVGNEIVLSIGMQAKSVIEAAQYAFLALWQHKTSLKEDSRGKYKNGSVWYISVKNIAVCKRALKELSPFIALERKKYKSDYDLLVPNNSREDSVGVILSAAREEQCYDISVDSKTHLYLTANGLVTHNSDLIAEILSEDVEESGLDSLFMAKTQRQARSIIWPKIAAKLRHQIGWKSNESRLEYSYKGGPKIACKGADLRADDIVGGAYRIIACDEYALWAKPEIKDRVLAPMLIDHNGQFIFASTKRGKNHFHKLHMHALAHPEKYLVVEGTMMDNPFLSEDGRRKVIEEYPGGEANPLFQQEILNKYVVFEGQVFALDEMTYMDDLWAPFEYDHAAHWRGVDHGFSPDPTACVWIAYNEHRDYYQVYAEYKQQALLIKQHADAIESLVPGPPLRKFHQTISDIDPQIIAEYEAVGLSMDPADKRDKKARLLKLVNAMRIGRVKIARNCRMLLDEIASLTWDDIEKKTGEDHLIDAFDYGFNGLVMPVASQFEEDDMPKWTTNRNLTSSYIKQSFGD